MKTLLKVMGYIIAMPIFWLSIALLMLACAICPDLYPIVVKNFKNLEKNK